jgi:hypothetical protein
VEPRKELRKPVANLGASSLSLDANFGASSLSLDANFGASSLSLDTPYAAPFLLHTNLEGVPASRARAENRE